MLLIGNGRVITRDQENPYLEDGAVVVVGMGTDAYTHDMLESMKVFLIICQCERNYCTCK